MGLMDKINDARPNDFGSYIEPGIWKLEIQACKEVKPRAGGEAFTVEFRTLETDNPKFKVGQPVSWQAHSKHESAASNIRHFLADVFEIDFNDVDAAGYAEVVSAANPLAGTVVYALARNIKTRKGGDFTKISWSKKPFTAAQAAEAKAESEASAAR